MNKPQLMVAAVVLLSPAVATGQTPAHSEAARINARDSAAAIAARIRRADYEGDRASLQRLYQELMPLRESPQLGPKVRYWQGFALWRRAFNGFNDSVSTQELKHDLWQAVREFQEAVRQDPNFVDAKVGAISCLQTLIYLNLGDTARVRELVRRVIPLTKESLAADPENPRLLWVLGARQWHNPPERGGGQAVALATYDHGLRLARAQKESGDPLQPSWGEPELLMSLAWSHLNRTPPDLSAAEKYAAATLALVPHWRYVRDILVPQIRSAKEKR